MPKHSKSRGKGTEESIKGCGKFCFERQHMAVRLGSSTSTVCYWTVISNGSYGHLNNHLAHPPSLNSHYFFSPPSVSLSLSLFLLLFSEPRRYQRRTLWRFEKNLLSLVFHFFTVTSWPREGSLLFATNQESRTTRSPRDRDRKTQITTDEKSQTNEDVYGNIALLR